MTAKQDVRGYDRAFYTRNIPELRDWAQGRIRLEDMMSAILYACGYPSFQKASELFPLMAGRPFVEQATVVKRRMKRRPRFVVDIGAGRGEVCAFFVSQRIHCVAIDPAPGVIGMIEPTIRNWSRRADWAGYCRFLNTNAGQGVQMVDVGPGVPDTVLLVEALEHIPKKEFKRAYQTIVLWLQQTSGLLIVTNWLKYHPIRPNRKKPWCHVTTVDDRYYDYLARFAKSTVFRDRSHLVLRY